ncbi:MAG: sortase [Halioglobus sp.]|nr:sortase [Halioglobus sp.]|tara:strand:- start:560 stop:1195 length:636 start_codon:yes stop_codon:yes gene_type:complete
MSGKLSAVLRYLEHFCYLAGVLLAGFFFVQLAQGEIERRDGIQAFTLDLSGTEHPDTSLWSPGRIEDYRSSLDAALPDILGVLEIDALELKVPVYADSSEQVMDRGAGIIEGMAYPHEPGNIGISGHRDGYFRVLKDIRVGDVITLQTLEGAKRFTVDAIRIVDKADTSVLQDTREQTVTLVTCYPFYYVGPAPRRFVVTARLASNYVNRD